MTGGYRKPIYRQPSVYARLAGVALRLRCTQPSLHFLLPDRWNALLSDRAFLRSSPIRLRWRSTCATSQLEWKRRSACDFKPAPTCELRWLRPSVDHPWGDSRTATVSRFMWISGQRKMV